MSGFEIAGVALGIIPLIIKGYGSMGIMFENYTGFESHTRRHQKVYLIQRNQFRRSIRSLLLGFIDDSIIDDMIQDADHVEWESEECREAVSTLFSKDLGTSEEYKATVELIQSTLADIKKLCVSEQSPVFQAGNQSPKGWDRVTNAISDGKQRLHWAVSKKRKVDDLFSELSRYNHDLGRFVSQIRGNPKRASAKFTPRTTFENIKKIQSAYTELYRAVASACSTCNCRTHAVDLALEDEGISLPEQMLHVVPPEYKVMFHDGQESKVWCMRLKHLSPGHKPPPQIKPVQLPTHPKMAPGHQKPSSIYQGTTSIQNTKATKSVHFQNNLVTQAFQPTSCISYPTLSLSPPIQNLCLSLAALHLPPPEIETKHHQLGYLSDSGQSTYEVHLSGIESHPSDVYYSLNQVLSKQNTSDSITERVLQPYQRWKLAYLLSCSLLRLYSSPWLSERERWVSRNVKFFINRKSGSADNTSITTHLALGTETGADNDTSVVNSVKNYQIYALGVLLLQIALGKPLDTSIVTSNVSAELKEYLTVMRLDKHGIAAQTLGPQYGDIVTRCLSFKFDTAKHDLANIELQREFYNNVVCQLEGCLKIMTDPI